MKKWTLPIIGIICLSWAAISAYPKLTGSQEKTSPEFVPLTAQMPKRERVRVQEKEEDEGPVMIHVSGLKAQLESRQDSVEEATADLLKK